MKHKKILAALLALTMITGSLPMTVYAEDIETPEVTQEVTGTEEIPEKETVPEELEESELPEDQEDPEENEETDTAHVYNSPAEDPSNITDWRTLKDTIQADGEWDSVTIGIGANIDFRADEYGWIYVAAGKTVTIDLMGHTLNRNLTETTPNGMMFLVSGTLIIMDSVGGGKLTGCFSNMHDGDINSGGCIFNKGSVTLENIILEGNRTVSHDTAYGGAVYNSGTLTVTKCTFTGNKGGDAGAIYNAANGTVTITDSSFTGNESLLHGGGAIVNYGTLSLKDTTITGNHSKGNGGGVWNNGTMNIEGKVIIKNNTSDSNTPNLYLNSNKVITVTGSVDPDSEIHVTAQDLPRKVATGWLDGDDVGVIVFENGMESCVYDGDVGVKATYVKRVWDPDAHTVVSTPEECPVLPKKLTSNPGSGWYYVYGTQTIGSRIEIASGATVNLILADGATMNCTSGGIHLPGNAKLNIYGQSGDTGVLKATGGDKQAGIGGNDEQGSGFVVICGGNITAKGGEYAAGIGAGNNSSAIGNITILGGTVKATGGKEGAGIGSGADETATSGDIFIRGGTITAIGGASTNNAGAGIGGGSGGNLGSDVTITISGGKIYAEGGDYVDPASGKTTGGDAIGAAGIGSGSYCTGGGDFNGKILIEGGEIDARGSGHLSYSGGSASHSYLGGAGIGAGCGGNIGPSAEIKITGGKIESCGFFGGTAIGAGSEYRVILVKIGGECNGKVTINGGNIYLDVYRGAENTPYIGHGLGGSENGTLDLGNVWVKSMSGSYTTVSRDGRKSLCRTCDDNNTLWICSCTSHVLEIGDITETHHTYNCKYCSYSETDRHSFDSNDHCTVCGYDFSGTICDVTYNYGSGEPEEISRVPNGSRYTLKQFTHEAPEGKMFIKWKVVMNETTEYKNAGEDIIIAGPVFITPEYGSCARLAGYSVSLDGDIGVNFYMDIDPEIAANDQAYMKFTLPDGNLAAVSMAAARDKKVNVGGKDYYIFKVNIAAKDMNKDITAQFVVSSTVKSEAYVFSVERYIRYLIDPENQHAYYDGKELAESLLIYGSYAQAYFNESGDRIELPECSTLTEVNNITSDDLTDYAYDSTKTVLPDGVTFVGSSLSLKSETTLSLYFKSEKTLEFSCGTYTIESVRTDKYQIARIRGINARDLGNVFTLAVTGDGIDGSMEYCPMTYCYNVLRGNYSDTHKDVCRALFVFHEKASGYQQ